MRKPEALPGQINPNFHRYAGRPTVGARMAMILDKFVTKILDAGGFPPSPAFTLDSISASGLNAELRPPQQNNAAETQE